MPSTRSSASPRKLPHSSDTELFETPVRKRFRVDDDESVSQSPPSPRKRRMWSLYLVDPQFSESNHRTERYYEGEREGHRPRGGTEKLCE